MYLHIGDGEEIRGQDLIGIFTGEIIRSGENQSFRRANGIVDAGDAVKSYILTREGIKTSIVSTNAISARGNP